MDSIKEHKIIDMYLNNNTMAKVGQHYDVSPATVKYILNKYNIQSRSHGGINKLPELTIIKEYKEGKSSTLLAKQYNVSFSNIIYILKKYEISRNNKYKNKQLITDYWKNIDTIDKAYFLGFLITDGNIHKNCISLTLKNDISEQLILLTFSKYTRNENKISIHNRINTSEIRFQLKSNEWINDLSKYNVIPRKTNIVELPKLDDILMSHLIRGLFDGDGTISYKSHYISLCGNLLLISQVHDYLINKLNLKNNKIILNNNNLYSISWASINDIKKLGAYLYTNKKDCYLKRKYDNYMKIIHGNTEENLSSNIDKSPLSIENETN